MIDSNFLFDYIERPKTLDPSDFWGQVKRTLNGKPVPQEQIDSMFHIIRQLLDFRQNDVLLDICCGNGRLGAEFFNEVGGYLGVDLSPCLIEIAQNNFSRNNSHRFTLSDVLSYLDNECEPNVFSKAMCYGSCHGFTDEELKMIWTKLYERFVNIRTFLLGALPDWSRADSFFNGDVPSLNDHTSSTGRWFKWDELRKNALACGWNSRIVYMPDNFYQAHYRFNVILTRMN